MKKVTLSFLDNVSLEILENSIFKEGHLESVFSLRLFYTSPENTCNGAPLLLEVRNKKLNNCTLDVLRQPNESMFSLTLTDQRDINDVNKKFISRHYLLRTKISDAPKDFMYINFYRGVNQATEVMIFCYDEKAIDSIKTL